MIQNQLLPQENSADFAICRRIGEDSLQNRLKEGEFWEEETLNTIPMKYAYRKATLTEDCVKATDRKNLFETLNVRSRKRPKSQKFYDVIKNEFTFRLEAKNGHTSEFHKVFKEGCGDAMIYSFHDETNVIRWVIIDLNVLRQEWNDWLIDPNKEPFFTDQVNNTDACPFRVFDLTRIKNPRVVIATSPGFF